METDLIAAVRAVAAGERFVSAELQEASAPGSRAVDPDDEKFSKLSAREIQVLRLIALGKTNKEIGVLLGVSANTVAVHRTNLMATLNLHKAAELVLVAVKRGLVNPE